MFDDDVAAFLDAGADMVLAKPLGMGSVRMLLAFIVENEGSSSEAAGSTLTRPSGGRSHLVEQNNRLCWSI